MRSIGFLTILLLGGQNVSSSFHLPAKKSHVSSHRTSSLEKSYHLPLADGQDPKHAVTALGVASGGASTPSDRDLPTTNGIMKASMVVGVLTATMGYVYGKVLSFCVQTMWHTLPKLFDNLNPAYFITGLCTCGGLLMGILSSLLSSSTFTVADFVAIFSGKGSKSLPSSKTYLLPLLLLSLVTSTFGFSVGPEAPMVCAGALLGASCARYFYGDQEEPQETLAYAGASGALTAFMGIPVAGSIFALELTSSHAGMNEAAGKRALSSTIMSSIAALFAIRAVLNPSGLVGGHFAYESVGALTGCTTIATAIACGAGGGLLGTVFHKLVGVIKTVSWNMGAKSDATISNKWKRPVLVKTMIGFLVGLLSVNYPQTLFWGEGSLQTVISGHATPFSATKHGLSNLLTSAARVNPNLPFASASAAAQVGIAKLVAIALACAGKFPGGIIFPLMFAAAPLAHSVSTLLSVPGSLVPLIVMCLMASTQAAVTRTPLATALILSLTASGSTELSVMLPGMVLSSYLGVYFSRVFSKNSYFGYNEKE